MGILRFAQEQIGLSIAVVVGALFAIYGVMSGGLDLYQAGLPGWAWTALGLVIFFASTILLLYRFSQRLPSPPSWSEPNDPDWQSKLEVVAGRHFQNCEVPLDGRRYVKCEFAFVTFVYNGGPFGVEGSSIGPHSIKTENPALGRFGQLLLLFGHISSKIQTETGITTLDQLDAVHGTRRSGSTSLFGREGSEIEVGEIDSSADTLADVEGRLSIQRALHDPAGTALRGADKASRPTKPGDADADNRGD